MSDTEQLNKWRLILGKYAKNQISFNEALEGENEDEHE